jgi:hypothetical protein
MFNNGIFNAYDYDPTQGIPKHPVCQKEPAYIANTELKPGKDGVGTQFAVTFTTKLGSIVKNYQIEFPNNKEVEEISRRQLSAVCHATETYQISITQGGRELINKQLLIDVTVQAKDDKYNEVSTVYKMDGNKPARIAAASATPAQPSMQPQPGFAGGSTQAFAPQGTQQPMNGFQPPQTMQGGAGSGFAPPSGAPNFAPQAGAPMPDSKPAWAR